MPVYYKKYQSHRQNSPNKGMWYGRIVYQGTVNEYDLAKAIEEKCTVHRADVVAVILALVDEMTRALQSSQRVHLTNFGTFKLGMSTKPAETSAKFTAENVKSIHVLFQPELHINRGSHSRTRAMITGTVVKEISHVPDTDKSASSDSGKSAGDTDA